MIGFEQGLQTFADLLLDQAAHAEHLVANVFEFKIELLRDMLIEVKLVHGHAWRLMASRIGR